MILRKLCLCVFLFAGADWGQSFSFQTPASYPAQGGAASTAAADFDGDGNLDLAVGNAASSSVSIYLGKGDGTFGSQSTVAVPGSCVAGNVATEDFNNDGKADVLVVCGFQPMLWVLPGLGNGQFAAPISAALPQAALAGLVLFDFHGFTVADFNRDGKLDVVALTSDQVASSLGLTAVQMVILLGKGDGSFQPAATISSPNFAGYNVAAADFNGDGIPDLAIDVYQSGINSIEAATLQIMIGNGQGQFTLGASYSMPGAVLVGSLITADVNHDSVPDLLVSSANGPNTSSLVSYLTVLLGRGDGTFKTLASSPETTPVYAMAVGDFRGSGNLDLVQYLYPLPTVIKGSGLTVSGTSMVIRAGNGDGTFQSPVTLAVPANLDPFAFAMVTKDFNGDGLPDLAFTVCPPITVVKGAPGDTGAEVIVEAYQALPTGNLVVLLNAASPTEPVISLTQHQLQLSAVVSGASASQMVTISNSGVGTLKWTATSSASWLTISPASGTGTTSITIKAAPGSMTPNTYNGTVTIAATGAANSPQTIAVTFTVTAATNLPTITSVLNGASFLPGFEAGSWVTIKGSNLSNTNPGRTWTSAEIVNGKLPTSLDNTSVTIDGKAAYVYYISPTQINVQAPDDSVVGPVQVVVKNGVQVSNSFTAQLQSEAPAFFQYGGMSFAIATRYPDNALIGDPSAAPGTIAAKPGDVLILWATGFGPTSPPTAAGAEVVVAPSVATLPTVTVGGMPVTVIGAALSPGSAGLYQVAIQLPANVPTGDVAIQGTVSAAQSPAGILIDVASQ